MIPSAPIKQSNMTEVKGQVFQSNSLSLGMLIKNGLCNHKLWQMECINKFENIIELSETVIQDLLKANNDLQVKCYCLTQEKQNLVTQVYQLRKRIEHMETAQAQYNQTIYLQKSISKDGHRLFERLNQSMESQLYMIDPDSADREKTQFQYIECISGQKRAQMSKEQQTPILHQPIFKQNLYKTSYTVKGLIRAFYSKTLSNPICMSKLLDIIDEDYRKNEYLTEGYLFDKYPDNVFMSDMMTQFLDGVDKIRKYCDVLDHLNQFQLYDDVLVQIYSKKLSTYFDVNIKLDSQSTKRGFIALAQVMALNVEVVSNTAYFYQECNRQIRSQNSESKYNVYEEISLNPKPKDSISCIPNDIREPLFTIDINHQEGFTFLIKEEKNVDDLILNDSDLNISQSKESNDPKAFESSLSKSSLPPLKGDHYIDVQSALSQSPKLQYNNFLILQEDPKVFKSRSKQSEYLLNQARKNHIQLRLRGSFQTVLISGYSNSNRASQQIGKELFKSLKEPGHKSNNISARKDNQRYIKASSNPSGVVSPNQRKKPIIQQSDDFDLE